MPIVQSRALGLGGAGAGGYPAGTAAAAAAGGGFHDALWKLFFFRTLALYAARICAVASLASASTLPAVDAADATLGARELVLPVPLGVREWLRAGRGGARVVGRGLVCGRGFGRFTGCFKESAERGGWGS